MRLLEGGEGTGIDEELVHADETADVASGHVLDGLHTATHHQDGPLDRLFVQVTLGSRDEVGPHDPGLHAGGDLAGEHATECVEAALVGGGDHLGHVHHEGRVGVAVLDAHADDVVVGSLVEQLGPVLLGGDGARQMDRDHLEHSLTGRQPVPHDTHHEGLALQLLLLGLQHVLDQLAMGIGQLGEQLLGLLLFEVHDGVKDHVDGVQESFMFDWTVVVVLLGVRQVGEVHGGAMKAWWTGGG